MWIMVHCYEETPMNVDTHIQNVLIFTAVMWLASSTTAQLLYKLYKSGIIRVRNKNGCA